jgi:hypothetical protein
MDELPVRLRQLIFAYWHGPTPEGNVFLHRLLTAPCSRVVRLRHHLALAETVYPSVRGREALDLGHTFRDVLTPRFMLDLCRDLRSTQLLSSAQAMTIEEALLSTVSSRGSWKAV